MTILDLLVAAEALVLSSFLATPIFLIAAGYLIGERLEPYRGRRELVNAHRGGGAPWSSR